ncbi:MAG: dephospho-CoA kinase [Myxococcales bacterium]|nr:dephospho-CoA kinase [Myxococcales bacterium]
MRLFGLTGGIASGKSAVARRLRARGVPVIDADQLAREAVMPGTPGLSAIVATFGDGVLDAEGKLDRKALASLVFGDDAKRAALNAIVHPRVTALTMERAAALAERGEPLACYEAALLVENGVADAFRPLVVVSAPADVQIARAMARDGATEAEARARLAAQAPLAAKAAAADHVIDNRGTLEDLDRRTDEVLAAICRDQGVDPSRYPTDAPGAGT